MTGIAERMVLKSGDVEWISAPSTPLPDKALAPSVSKRHAKAEKPAAAVVAITVTLASQIEALANELTEESISGDEFVAQARAALLAAGADAAELAKLDDDAFVEALVAGKAEYLPGFASDLIVGMSDLAIVARAALWGGVAWTIYQSARGEVAKQDGLTSGTWVLDPSAQHCDSCLEYADNSPYAIEDVPTPGMDTDCLDHCRCSVEYS